MKISEIMRMPTSITYPGQHGGFHESILRSSQINEKVKYYLREGVPPKIILELIDEMESADAEVTLDLNTF